jgi:hypothetical protein
VAQLVVEAGPRRLVRVAHSPMSRREFEAVLADAVVGTSRADTGAHEELETALQAIVGDSPDPDPKLIQAARDAYARQRRRERVKES